MPGHETQTPRAGRKRHCDRPGCARMRGRRAGFACLLRSPPLLTRCCTGVFDADSATGVTLACRLAGWPVDRVAEGVLTRLLPQ